jgi:hypothetical protein
MDAGVPPLDDLDVLRGMAARIRASQPTDPHQIERALETGFALMIGLEAELSRAQASARKGSEPDAAAITEFKARIDMLREALIDLRTLSVAPGETRIGYGFVLPGPQGRTHAHPN